MARAGRSLASGGSLRASKSGSSKLKLPQDNKDNRLCKCHSHDCKARVWVAKSGAVQTGNWVHKSTFSRHAREDKDLIKEGVIRPDSARDAVAKTPVPGPEEISKNREPASVHVMSNRDDNSPFAVRQRLVFIACSLVAWLHLVAGISRDAGSRVLQVLVIIISMVASDTAGTNHKVPVTVQTAMQRLSIEPLIERSICCPKCFRAYSLADLPQRCLARKSPQSNECGTPLWVQRQTRAGPKVVPRRLYSTQNFESWLSHFLSRPGMEELLHKSTLHTPNPQRMASIWDSPAWQSLGTFTHHSNNLVFSLYIDWFNPYTNKIAGKVVSCGAIMAIPLDLPIEMWRDEENCYFVGITPGPHEPTVDTITNLLDPIMDQFAEMWKGKKIPTHNHPDGDFYRTAIVPAIGDILALKKLLGCAGHASIAHFCSFCKLRLDEIDRLDYTNFEPRTGADVFEAATAWFFADSQSKRDKILRDFGNRWSSTHKLRYRDPVKHTVLGLMHAWLEGVLQHHCRLKWGIGSKSTASDTPSVPPPASSLIQDIQDDKEHAAAMVVDQDMVLEEIADLEQDSLLHNDTPAAAKRAHFVFVTESEDADENRDAETQPSQAADGDAEDAEDTEDDVYDRETPIQMAFDDNQMAFIRKALAEVKIPSWIDRPPVNLGEKAHGKLKADNWWVLFSVFFPLILPEIWCHGRPSDGEQPSDRDVELLVNFHDLIAATNIVCGYTVSPGDADRYLAHYIGYLRSSKTLFPGLSTRPNHHYAMHFGDQLKWWGPLIRLSEFAYESHNGGLQKINTNNHMWELDLTMLRQKCRRGRLLASLHDSAARADSGSPIAEVVRVLAPVKHSSPRSPTPLSTAEEIAHNGSGRVIETDTYELLLDYWNKTSAPPYIRPSELTFSRMESGVCVFPVRAKSLTNFVHNTRSFSTLAHNESASSITFNRPGGGKDAGFIQSIWSIALQGEIRTFIIVQPHAGLSEQDNLKIPYPTYPGFACFVGYARPASPRPLLVIEPRHVITHLPYLSRPTGTYGIQQEIRVYVDSLERNRGSV